MRPDEAKPISEGPPGETKEEARQRLRAFLASLHTGEKCPRDPSEQFKAPGTWTRQMVMHVNVGRGVHLYVYKYTCVKCGYTVTVEQ